MVMLGPIRACGAGLNNLEVKKGTEMMTRMLVVCVAGLAASAAIAGDTAVVDLTGVRIQDGLDQARDSSPETIDPAFEYDYVIDGLVQGDGGIMEALFPDPTPLADVLEYFEPGSSEGLTGNVCNPDGTHPLELFNDHYSGQEVILGVTVTFAMDLAGGIDADDVAWVTMTNVVLSPSFLVGSLEFTEGSATMTRVECLPDFNHDCEVNSQDFIAFLNAFTAGDPSADFNGDGDVNSMDFIAFLNAFVAGCP